MQKTFRLEAPGETLDFEMKKRHPLDRKEAR